MIPDVSRRIVLRGLGSTAAIAAIALGGVLVRAQSATTLEDLLGRAVVAYIRDRNPVICKRWLAGDNSETPYFDTEDRCAFDAQGAFNITERFRAGFTACLADGKPRVMRVSAWRDLYVFQAFRRHDALRGMGAVCLSDEVWLLKDAEDNPGDLAWLAVAPREEIEEMRRRHPGLLYLGV